MPMKVPLCFRADRSSALLGSLEDLVGSSWESLSASSAPGLRLRSRASGDDESADVPLLLLF